MKKGFYSYSVIYWPIYEYFRDSYEPNTDWQFWASIDY